MCSKPVFEAVTWDLKDKLCSAKGLALPVSYSSIGNSMQLYYAVS